MRDVKLKNKKEKGYKKQKRESGRERERERESEGEGERKRQRDRDSCQKQTKLGRRKQDAVKCLTPQNILVKACKSAAKSHTPTK